MSDTHSGVLVRMPNELKAELQRFATLNGRTLTGEINTRLKDSLELAARHIKAPKGSAIPGSYPTDSLVTGLHTNEKGLACPLSDSDQAMLDVFRALPVEKQLALLSLFK
ncbi:Arc-like DNA binding domain containing protein [Comamonadaceae bacterium]